MLSIFNTREDNCFSWNLIGNIAEGRKNLEVYKIGILKIGKFDSGTSGSRVCRFEAKVKH